MTTDHTLVVLVDALRYDYIDEAQPSFLSNIKNKSISRTMKEVYGFQTRPAFFAGLYPEKSDIAHIYTFEQEESPFWVSKFIPRSILYAIDNSVFEMPMRKGISHMARLAEKQRGNNCSRYISSSAKIPLEFLENLSISERKSIQQKNSLAADTLFDVLRDHGHDWLWIGYPKDRQETDRIENNFYDRINKNHRLSFLHYAELDWNGHDPGPATTDCYETLEEIDSSIQRIHSHAKEMFGSVDLIVFGDHGMVPVDQYVDIESKLGNLTVTSPDDYFYFLDSNQARFVFHSDEAKKQIREILDKIECGYILTEHQRKKINANISARYGDLIFMLKPGCVFSPNFFQRDANVHGMHGYHPDVQNNHTELILYDPDDNYTSHRGDLVDLVDVFPTILDVMDLPIPESNQGKSLIK